MSLIEKLLRKPDINKIKEISANLKHKLCPLPYISKQEMVVPKRAFKMPPLLAGSMNHWQYTPMFKIEDLVAMLDQDHEDVIEKMVEQDKISEGVTSPA